MGLFDTIFGSKNKQKSTVVQDTDVAKSSTDAAVQQGTTQTGTVSAGQTQTGQRQAQTQTTLAPEVQQQLIGIISSLAGGGDDATARSLEASEDLAAFIANRAVTGDEDIAAQNEAILESARQEGENALEAATTRNAAVAGSTFNTLVQAGAQRGRNELETSLAGIAGQLNLSGRNQVSTELASALEGFSRVGELGAGAGLERTRLTADIAEVLKGARTVGELAGTTETRTLAEQQEVQQRQEALVRAIEELTQGRSTQVTDAEGRARGPIFDDIISLLSV